MLKQFYEKVLPSQGVYCLTVIGTDKQAYNRFAESLDALINLIEDLKQDRQNIFVAPASFKNFSRMAANAMYMRSFFIDLDVGEGKGYGSKEEALEALDHLISETELPLPYVVDSGGGIHAYWVFDADIPISEWKPYAEKFKAKVSGIIPIDMAVTADAARIMRAPFTTNYKYTPPSDTGLLFNESEQYSFEAFKDFLGVIEPTASQELLQVLAAAPKGLDDDTRQILKTDNLETVFDIIATKSMNGEGCNQIKYMIENAAILEEPLWHSGLSIARHCVDWEESIHELSREYPKYNAADTLRKANETHGKPHSCVAIESRNPGGCDGCPFRGKITNPLALGRHLKEAPEATEEDAVREEENPQAIPAFPASLRPYVRGSDGGIYFIPPPKVNRKGEVTHDDPILLFNHDIYPVKRMFSPIDGASLLMRLHLPNDGIREFTLHMKTVYAVDKLKETLGSVEASFFPRHIATIADYFVKWNQHMINAKTAEQMRMQMGWTDDKSGFVAGHREIRSDGKVIQTAPSPMVNAQAKLIRTEGSYDLWKNAANKLNMVGFELHAFTLFAGFGSPLMHLTSTSGVALCLTGPSGNAKTGALYAQLSIYGDPKGLSLAGEKSATENALTGWMLGLKNIPLGIDEASNKKPESLSHLIHNISQGKGKLRMQASVNAVREIEQNASLISTFTSNQSMYDKLTMYKAAPDGEVARIIEFMIPKPVPLAKNPELGREIFDVFRNNYGHAVFDFVAKVFSVGWVDTKLLIEKWIARFDADFGNDNTYRFYANAVGSSMAGGELACMAGILTIDLERVYRTVVAHIKDIRDKTIKINNIDYKDLIGEFNGKFQTGTLVIDNGRVVKQPYASLVARKEVGGTYYVSKTEFKKYLAELQVSAREFEEAMTNQGVLTFSGKQRLANGWSGMTSSPIAVYGFNNLGLDDDAET